METMDHKEWLEVAREKFGKDPKGWKFVCPECGTVQSIQDFMDLGMDIEKAWGYIAYHCIGRYTDKKGCDFSLNKSDECPIEIIRGKERQKVFDFAGVEGE